MKDGLRHIVGKKVAAVVAAGSAQASVPPLPRAGTATSETLETKLTMDLEAWKLAKKAIDKARR